MHLLNTMTGATPETRLIVLAWAAHFDFYFASGTEDVFAALTSLGVSKRHLGIALEYLVREGYLWKTENAVKQTLRGRFQKRFCYGLTQACLSLWHDSLKVSVWAGELCYLLTCNHLVELKRSKKSNVSSLNMRLVWVALVAQVNEAGYVVGCDSQVLSKMLGMTGSQLQLAIEAILQSGAACLVAAKITSSPLFGRILPIYKVFPRRPDKKIIKLAVFLPRDTPKSFRFLRKLYEYQSKVNKRYKGASLPAQISMSSDEDYFELSKITCSDSLVTTIHYLCLSTLLSLVPSYASALKEYISASSINDGLEAFASLLPTIIRQKLSEVLSVDGSSILEKEFQVDESDEPLAARGSSFLRSYTLEELTAELSGIVTDIAEQWNLYIKSYGVTGARIVDYFPDMEMVSYPSHVSEIDTNDNPSKCAIYRTSLSHVFAVQVPNETKYDDCMVMGDVLLTVNSEVSGPQVCHVKEIVCRNQGSLFK